MVDMAHDGDHRWSSDHGSIIFFSLHLNHVGFFGERSVDDFELELLSDQLCGLKIQFVIGSSHVTHCNQAFNDRASLGTHAVREIGNSNCPIDFDATLDGFRLRAGLLGTR